MARNACDTHRSAIWMLEMLMLMLCFWFTIVQKIIIIFSLAVTHFTKICTNSMPYILCTASVLRMYLYLPTIYSSSSVNMSQSVYARWIDTCKYMAFVFESVFVVVVFPFWFLFFVFSRAVLVFGLLHLVERKTCGYRECDDVFWAARTIHIHTKQPHVYLPFGKVTSSERIYKMNNSNAYLT